jgi:hypothetical protein
MSDAYKTETRESGTMSFRVEWFYDDDSDAPWDREDGHGPVSDWETREKRPGEMILSSERRHSKRFYDFTQAVKIARRDGWNTAPFNWPTEGARAHAAAMEDFDRLRQWCADQWHYCGIVVTLLDADGEPDSVDASLWGIESDSPESHEEVIGELIDECLSQITATIGD